jgi:iron-sulfur cluster assembly accessory protein
VLSISEKAADKARNILAIEGKDGWGLRIYSAGQSCCGPSYGLDIEETPQAQDEILEKDGLKVFVDRQSLDALTGMQLDYYEDDEREGFILTGGAAPSCSSGCSTCG